MLTNTFANFLLIAIANNQPCCSLTCDPPCRDLNVFNLPLFSGTSQANVGYLKHFRFIFVSEFSPAGCDMHFEFPLRKWFTHFIQPWWSAWHLPACSCPKSVKVTDRRERRGALKSLLNDIKNSKLKPDRQPAACVSGRQHSSLSGRWGASAEVHLIGAWLRQTWQSHISPCWGKSKLLVKYQHPKHLGLMQVKVCDLRFGAQRRWQTVSRDYGFTRPCDVSRKEPSRWQTLHFYSFCWTVWT